MITTWYHPNWCGDFRLEDDPDAEGAAGCLLKVADPTPAELEQLGDFLAKARQRKWISEAAGVSESGETVLTIKATVVEAGRILIGEERLKAGVLTSVRSSAGAVSVVIGNDPDEVAQEAEKEEAEQAVTTPRPTCCCPNPTPGPEERASEVLRAFCTNQQWEEWEKHGFLHARGCYTGHLYRIAHRHSPIAVKQGKVSWAMTDDAIMHCHVTHLPPPEEVLAIKQTIEHAEHWVRNPSGALGMHRSKLHNPFMAPNRQGADGIPDTVFVSEIGAVLKPWARMLGLLKK